MGCASSKTECQETRCGNGVIQRGSRVQTQWDEGKGHDMKWYVGSISAVYTDGDCSIDYDDPDKWTGGAQWVYMLPVGHPGHTMKIPMGADTQNGPPGMGNPGMGAVAMAQPVMAQPAMAMPVGGGGYPMGGGMPMGGPATAVAMPMGAPPPQASPGMVVLTATVPPGHNGTVTIQGPQGTMEVPVPQGLGPGQTFQFQAPAPPQPMGGGYPMGGAVQAQPVVVMGNAV